MGSFLFENGYELRPLLEVERNYTYWQGQQISQKTGFIGYLRADMGSSGKEFWSTWNDFSVSRKTDEFKAELDSVINDLRGANGILTDRQSLASYCLNNRETSFENGREFGVRIDTNDYSYLLRLNPYGGEYNLYCHCYEKIWLDLHMKHAEKGIRFITPEYDELFRIPDGESVRITRDNGSHFTCNCRYIDDSHVEIGGETYHICEFAEKVKREGLRVEPVSETSRGIDDVLAKAKVKAEAFTAVSGQQPAVSQVRYGKEER